MFRRTLRAILRGKAWRDKRRRYLDAILWRNIDRLSAGDSEALLGNDLIDRDQYDNRITPRYEQLLRDGTVQKVIDESPIKKRRS